MPSELTGVTQTLIINTLLVHKSLTLTEFSKITGKNRSTLKSSMSTLRALNIVHVSGYAFAKSGRESVIWSLGNKPDAPRPDFKGERRKEQQRKAQRIYSMKKKLRKIGPSPWAGLMT